MNQAWQDAIKQSEEALKGHETEIKDWFELGGEYAYDAFLSDIISALSMDKIDVPYFHGIDYWMYPLNREREVFANLAAIDVLDGVESLSNLKELSGIVEVYKKIIHSGGII